MRTIGNLRRSAASASRARVASFSLMSSLSRAACHSAGETTCGLIIAISLGCGRLFFGDGLQIGKSGVEVLADHPVHADEDADDLRDVGRGTVHGPGDGRRVAFWLERE